MKLAEPFEPAGGPLLDPHDSIDEGKARNRDEREQGERYDHLDEGEAGFVNAFCACSGS